MKDIVHPVLVLKQEVMVLLYREFSSSHSGQFRDNVMVSERRTQTLDITSK